MKHLKSLNESNDDFIKSCFHFLIHVYGNLKWRDDFNKGIDFLKSLNLTDEQYKQLGQLFEKYEEYIRELEDDRRSDDEYFNRFRE